MKILDKGWEEHFDSEVNDIDNSFWTLFAEEGPPSDVDSLDNASAQVCVYSPEYPGRLWHVLLLPLNLFDRPVKQLVLVDVLAADDQRIAWQPDG